MNAKDDLKGEKIRKNISNHVRTDVMYSLDTGWWIYDEKTIINYNKNMHLQYLLQQLQHYSNNNSKLHIMF